MSKARLLGMKTGYTPNSRAQMPFKKGKPNNNRCPKCQAKLKKRGFGISCMRCGYTRHEEEDNITKALYNMDYAKF